MITRPGFELNMNNSDPSMNRYEISRSLWRDNRREMLKTCAATIIGGMSFSQRQILAYEVDPAKQLPVSFALNTSTIRGQNLTIDKQVAVVGQAGYDGIEPWIRDLRDFVEKGGNLSELKKQIDDAGLKVVSAIGFAKWIVDDEKEREAALQQLRSDMELVAKIGGTHIAAPPVGVHQSQHESPPIEKIAERYAAALDIGVETGVDPQLELWGFSKTLSTLGELAHVATAANRQNSCVLPDFYHIYKGAHDPTNPFDGLHMIEASKMHCFHLNDYPATPPQSEIADKDRVFPGDGVCDLPNVIRQLIDHGFCGFFSLELFNPEYWRRDAFEVCQEGLQKSRAVVKAAMDLPKPVRR